jgi:ribosome-associated protein
MEKADEVRIDDRLTIPASELEFTFATGGGPGGQHVNKTATKVTLHFDVVTSPSLDDAQRALVLERLASRLDSDGVLRIQVHETRSQAKNREIAVARLKDLLARALRPVRPRRPTKPSQAAKQRRLESKRRHSETKRRRRYTPDQGE